MKLRKISVVVLSLVAVSALFVWNWSEPGIDSAEASLAVFQVDKMTCGSCVSNIQNALASVEGVGDVEVSVTAGRSKVEYDAALTTPALIAEVISASGYPATVRETLDVSEYQALKAEEGRLAGRYVARIGERLLPRAEFQAALDQRKSGLPQPLTPESLNQLRQQVWSDLRQRELLLNAAEQSQVVVQEGEVAAEIEKLKAGHEGFEQLIAERFGSLEAFSRQIKNDLIIRKHLDENVAAAAVSDAERQQQLNSWYRQLVESTPVVVFDPALKAVAAGSGSGCGGSCCG